MTTLKHLLSKVKCSCLAQCISATLTALSGGIVISATVTALSGGIVHVRASWPGHHRFHKKKIKFWKMLGWDTYPYKNSYRHLYHSSSPQCWICWVYSTQEWYRLLEETLMTGKFKEHVTWSKLLDNTVLNLYQCHSLNGGDYQMETMF